VTQENAKRQHSNGEWRPKETTLQARASEHISESFKMHQKDNRARMTSGEVLNTEGNDDRAKNNFRTY